MQDAVCSNNDSLRVYKEGSLRYTYHAESEDMDNRYCIITYPDNTILKTNNPETVFNNIKINRKIVHIGKYSVKHDIYYARDYRDYFSSFKRITINKLLNSGNIKREKITINDLLNPVKVEKE